MSLDEQIEVLTELLNRVLAARSSPAPLLLTDEVILAELDASPDQDDTMMRTYISMLEDAVRRARIELSPGIAQKCFSDLDAWLRRNYWLDFVHR